MGFGEAAINIQIVVQKLFTFPIIYDIPSNRLVINPEFVRGKEGKSSFPIVWYSGSALIFGLLLYIVGHLFRLLAEFQVESDSKLSIKDTEEIALYVITTAIIVQALVTWYIFETKGEAVCSTLNDIFTKCGTTYVGPPSKGRVPDKQEAAAYLFASGLVMAPPVSASFPFLRDYDPISRLLSNFMSTSNTPVKIFSSISILILVGYGAAICSPLLSLVTHACVSFTAIVKYNLVRSLKMESDHDRDRNGQLKMSTTGADRSNLQSGMSAFANRKTRSVNTIFRDRFLLHIELYRHLKVADDFLGTVIPTLQAIGLTLCISINYVVITFSDKLEMHLILFLVQCSVIQIIFNVLMLTFSAQSNVLSEKTIHYWKGIKLGVVERRQLKSMPVVALQMGGFFRIGRSSAMDVLETITTYTMDSVTA